MLTKLEHKVPPPIWGLIFGIIMWLLATYLPLISWQTELKCILAFVLITGGVAIDFYSIFSFFRAKTTINPLSPDASLLVVDGLNCYSRNPMYLGLFLILFGWGCYLGAMSALLVLPIFIKVITRLQIVPEERKLLEIFGDDYRNYCQRVRRWI